MKRLAFVLASLLSMTVGAATLTSDPLDPKTAYADIRVDGVIVSDCGSLAATCIAPLAGGNAIWYDVSRFVGTGQRTFEARTCNEFSCSAWSQPLVIDMPVPGAPTGLIIIFGQEAP